MISYEMYEKIRDSKGMKNSDVARIAAIPPSTFSDWKKGKSSPKQEKLQKIANALNVSFAELIGYEEKKEVPQYNPAIQEFVEILPRLTAEQIDLLLNTARLFVVQNDVQ